MYEIELCTGKGRAFKEERYVKKYNCLSSNRGFVYASENQCTINYWQNRYKNLRAKFLLLGLELTLS